MFETNRPAWLFVTASARLQKTPLTLWNPDFVVVRLRRTKQWGVLVTILSDTDLLRSAREGNQTALTELYLRHRGAARRVAAGCRRGGDPDDLVNDAFEKVFAAIRRQKGPTEAFRAYLFVTIRRLAARYAARNHDDPYEEVPEPVLSTVSSSDGSGTVMDAAERQLVTRAFSSLPERWQAVLWLTAVEGHHPREVAGTLGMKANAVSALAYRSREKLRQAYLQAHLQAAPRPECEPHRSALGAYVRDGLGKRDHTTTARHVESCRSCRSLVDELADVNQLLARSVMPMFLATGIGEAATAGTGGTSAAGLTADAVSEVSDHDLADLVDLVDVLDVAPRTGRAAHLLPDAVSTSQMAGGVAASIALLIALGTSGSMLLDNENPNPSTETSANAEPTAETTTTSPTSEDGDEASDGREENRPSAAALPTLDVDDSATCLPGAAADADQPDDGAAGQESTGTDDQVGLLGLKLDLVLPGDLTSALDTSTPEIQAVDCDTDTSSGEDALVVTIGEPNEPDEPEGREPDPVVEVDTGDVNVDPLPGVVPEVEASTNAYVDEELGVGAAIETNLDELCEYNEERQDLVCTLDSTLGGLVTGTLSETGTELQLDGPGGQVVALELLTDGNIVADTKVLNLLP